MSTAKSPCLQALFSSDYVGLNNTDLLGRHTGLSYIATVRVIDLEELCDGVAGPIQGRGVQLQLVLQQPLSALGKIQLLVHVLENTLHRESAMLYCIGEVYLLLNKSCVYQVLEANIIPDQGITLFSEPLVFAIVGT